MTLRLPRKPRVHAAIMVFVGLGLIALVASWVVAQVTPISTTATSGSTDIIQQLLQGATTQLPGTTSQPSTTTPTSTTPLTGRQSTIQNQFTSATGGAIESRRPGLWVEQGIAEHTGNLDIPGDAQPKPDSFFRQTFDMMFQDVLTLFSNILTGVDALLTGGSGGGSKTLTFVSPPNASTTWSATQQTIP